MNHLWIKPLLAIVATGSIATACAAETYNDWATSFKCGGQSVTLISKCRTAKEADELNKCQPNQRLAIGSSTINLPANSRPKSKPALFAIHWHCIDTTSGPVLHLNYFSGQSQGPDDELNEFLDLKLRPITAPSEIRELFQKIERSPGGYVRSIMP